MFERARDYDTMRDNIVRVHASTLRKRLEQYFAGEGANEPLILEIPRGNYAPVFRTRELAQEMPRREPPASNPAPAPPVRDSDWRIPTLAALALLYAVTTCYLLMRGGATKSPPATSARPIAVQLFWSQIFQSDPFAFLALLTFDSQSHLLAESAADKAAHRVSLPVGGSHDVL